MLDYGMNIPLFPLNTVLFPGMMLPLHIFEDRYKMMINECLAGDNTFGVVLAKNKQAVAPNVSNIFSDDLFDVGTTAHITAVEHLKDDRLNLITVGQERFVIKRVIASEQDYLVGEVNPFPIRESAALPQLEPVVSKKLKPMVQEYIKHLADASGEDLSNATLPNDPISLAYLAGTAVQGPLVDKQHLLSAKSTGQLVSRSVSMLDRENKIMAYMLKAYHRHEQIERLPFVDYSLN